MFRLSELSESLELQDEKNQLSSAMPVLKEEQILPQEEQYRLQALKDHQYSLMLISNLNHKCRREYLRFVLLLFRRDLFVPY